MLPASRVRAGSSERAIGGLLLSMGSYGIMIIVAAMVGLVLTEMPRGAKILL